MTSEIREGGVFYQERDYAGVGRRVLVWFGYFVLLKGSRFRTAGYLLMSARIVNLRGERPSQLSLLIRLLLLYSAH